MKIKFLNIIFFIGCATISLFEFSLINTMALDYETIKEQGFYETSITLGTVHNNTNEKITLVYYPHGADYNPNDKNNIKEFVTLEPHSKPKKINVRLPIKIAPSDRFLEITPMKEIIIMKGSTIINFPISIKQTYSIPHRIFFQAGLKIRNTNILHIEDELPQERLVGNVQKINFVVDLMINDPLDESIIEVRPIEPQ